MSFGSDPEIVTTQQRSDPWGPQQPYLTYGFSESANRYANPASRIAPMSAPTALALRLAESRATGGSPLLNAAQDETGRVLRGDYLRAGNPYAGGVAQAVGDIVQPQIQSRFTAAGGRGAAVEPALVAREIANALAPVMFADYGNERGRMMAALGLAPGLAREDYGDIGQLSNVGAALEQFTQRQLLEPDELLDQYLKRVTGSFGRNETTSQPFYRNTGAGILGGGLAGLTAANALNELGFSGSGFAAPLALSGALLGGFF